MQITFTATLTSEQIFILAKQKGYSDTISTVDNWEIIDTPNPVTAEEFIKQVYTSLIINDATDCFLRHINQQKEQERIEQENLIRTQVSESITSSLWEL